MVTRHGRPFEASNRIQQQPNINSLILIANIYPWCLGGQELPKSKGFSALTAYIFKKESGITIFNGMLNPR